MFDESTLGKKVPNQFPTSSGLVPYKIAFIGEAPGADEVAWKRCSSGHEHGEDLCPQCGKSGGTSIPKPFVGASGQLLTGLLMDAGINRQLCYLGNVSQYRPPGNDIKKFNWDSYQIQSGIAQLHEDIRKFDPNLIVMLGGTPLRVAKGTYRDHKGKEKNHLIGNWRGSIFECTLEGSPFYGRKVMATYHPAYLFRVYNDIPLVRFDLSRARKHGTHKDVPVSGLLLDVNPHFETTIKRMQLIRENRIPISIDIEGYVNDIWCISISPTPKESFIVPFTNMDGSSFWSLQEEVKIMEELALLLADVNVPKVLQNGMYDRFVLAYSWKMLVRNMRDDTMLKHWEVYCEFEKSLALQTSIYTEHPYYKSDRKSDSRDVYWSYCCKDSAITNEINEKTTKLLKQMGPGSERHYGFNMAIQDPFLFIELRGMRVDSAKRKDRMDQLRSLAWFDSKKDLSGGTEQLKLEEMVGWQVNVNSSPDMNKLLYEQLKLPAKYKQRKNEEFTTTADYETLLRFAKSTKDPILFQCIKVRQIRRRLSDIVSLTTDPDGRIRSSTNIVGTETGRSTSSESPTGEGRNLQNITADDRDLLIADVDHDFGQSDLEGADSWTVAAHCARLGDSTMLDDLLAGLKPAQVLAMLVLSGHMVNQLDRPSLKQLIKQSDLKGKNKHIYFMCKKGTHGTNYRMGPRRLADIIFMDSEGEIDISETEAKKIQELYLARYKGVRRWHDWCENELKTKGYLISASGNKRLFFGRKNQSDTLGQFCSTEPQANTTYAINLMLKRLWEDQTNYNPDGSLKIWPCHQVHDALCKQWHVSIREQAAEKIKSYFANPLMIAGIQITIPYEGKYGPSWGEQPNNLN